MSSSDAFLTGPAFWLRHYGAHGATSEVLAEALELPIEDLEAIKVTPIRRRRKPAKTFSVRYHRNPSVVGSASSGSIATIYTHR